MSNNHALVEQMEILLIQKGFILNQILTITKNQLKSFLEKEINIDYLNQLIEDKETNLQKLTDVDGEIDSLIVKLKGFNRGVHFSDLIIEKLDDINTLIKTIDTSEKEAKTLFDNHIDKNKKHIKTLRTNKNITSKYNKNMGNAHQSDMSYFLDKKK